MRASSAMHRTAVVVLLAPTVTLACGGSRAARRPAEVSSSAGIGIEIPRHDLDSLRTRVSTAYDLIGRLRPAILTPRDPRASTVDPRRTFTETPGVSVYVDGLYLGGLEVLHTIAARSVISVRRVSTATASGQLGAGLSAGAIVITTDVPRQPNRF